MFRLWGKLFKDNRMLKDTIYLNDDSSLNRTRKVFKGLEEICNEFDLAYPIWLDQVVKEFQRHSKCRFRQDSFVEEFLFDFLEIEVIEED
ncbi:hypothetical protein P261_01307 [Lachnospiraceae bacterium TWA4]|nr:hypothetical protein P261_01307 [Lachnospiraceae bacterium TWA4]